MSSNLVVTVFLLLAVVGAMAQLGFILGFEAGKVVEGIEDAVRQREREREFERLEFERERFGRPLDYGFRDW